YYKSLGSTAEFYIPNNGKDPDDRYHLRGNGVWDFQPNLTRKDSVDCLHSWKNVAFDAKGARPEKSGELAELVFKVQGANVITSQRLRAKIHCTSPRDRSRIEISSDNGLHWTEAWSSEKTAVRASPVELALTKEVNGAYEVLIKVELKSSGASTDL